MSKTQKKAVVKTQTKASKPILDSTEKTVMIPVEKILKPLEEFRTMEKDAEAEDKLAKEVELIAENMKVHGQLHPIIVREENGKFRICTGALRYIACKMNEWKHVKAVIKDLSDNEVLELNVAENMCRIDLTSIQRESLVYKLWQTGNYDSYRHLGDKIGLTGERARVL